MKLYIKYILIALLLFSFDTKCQNIGYTIPDGAEEVKIPFELHNNLIVIPIIINEKIKLNFILDTGVQYPILTEKYFAEVIGLEYTRQIVIQGTGSIDSLMAKVAMGVKIELPSGVKSGMGQSLLVLEEDYLNLKESLGEEVYGIIGYDIFSRFVVEIDYYHRHLILHEPAHFKPRRSYQALKLDVRQAKPFVDLGIINNDEEMELLFMVDTGASHTLLVNDSENKILPSTTIPSVIGRGLGGDIRGNLGRVDEIHIGSYNCKRPIASFPLEGDYGSPISRGSRNGTVGSGLLSRFDVVFDYFSGYMYIKKNRVFGRSFEYDMSGLTLNVVNNLGYNEMIISAVRQESPAQQSGIKVGDVIERINGYDYEDLQLTGANDILRRRDGKKIVLKVRRGDMRYKLSFRLERLI